jgi:hypothetical protein
MICKLKQSYHFCGGFLSGANITILLITPTPHFVWLKFAKNYFFFIYNTTYATIFVL